MDRIHEYISNARKDYLDKISTEISKNHERYREFASINLKNEAIRFLNEVKEGEFNVYAYSLRDDKIKKICNNYEEFSIHSNSYKLLIHYLNGNLL